MKNAVDVHNFLVERDIAHEMVSVGGRVRAPDQVAGVLGLEPEQVGRVVLYEGAAGLVAAAVPAASDADARLVARAADDPGLAEVAPERATALTEFLDESLPPVALPEGTTLLLDRLLERQEVLYFPGGEPTSVLKIRPPDLLRATSAHVADVAG